jgi:hypothetical protein
MNKTINDMVREVEEGEGEPLKVEPCSNCKDNFFIEDLIWADKGGLFWLCQDCYNAEKGER